MQMPYPSFIIHRASDGNWTWQFAIADGVAIAGAAASYRTQQECAQAIQMLREATGVVTFGSTDDLQRLASSIATPGGLADYGDNMVLKAESLAAA